MEVLLTGDLSVSQGCSGDERQLADNLSKSISPGREPVKVTEGSESAEFWDSLGGKALYGSGELHRLPDRVWMVVGHILMLGLHT